MDNKPRIIAFYLPQYYPFKENDEWWGKGFTEWTNVGKAKPLFRGHYQPRVPADLGYYDLRVPEVREQQAELAKEAGVYGFCYWHYWFGNNDLLMNRVFDEVIENKTSDFPLCLGWANHSWYAKTWAKNTPNKLLKEQRYEGEEDFANHFMYALKAFKDKRYIKVDHMPVFFVYDAEALPAEFITIWNKLACENDFDGICFIGKINKVANYNVVLEKGFSYITTESMNNVSQYKGYWDRRFTQLHHLLTGKPRNCYPYKEAFPYFLDRDLVKHENYIPLLIPCWDHSPRSNNKGVIFYNSTPTLFREHIKQVFDYIKGRSPQHRVVFLKSWNEWAEGNYMEPDLKWGKQYIEALREEMDKFEG